MNTLLTVSLGTALTFAAAPYALASVQRRSDRRKRIRFESHALSSHMSLTPGFIPKQDKAPAQSNTAEPGHTAVTQSLRDARIK